MILQEATGMQSAEAYQAMLDRLDYLETRVAIDRIRNWDMMEANERDNIEHGLLNTDNMD